MPRRAAAALWRWMAMLRFSDSLAIGSNRNVWGTSNVEASQRPIRAWSSATMWFSGAPIWPRSPDGRTSCRRAASVIRSASRRDRDRSPISVTRNLAAPPCGTNSGPQEESRSPEA